MVKISINPIQRNFFIPLCEHSLTRSCSRLFRKGGNSAREISFTHLYFMTDSIHHKYIEKYIKLVFYLKKVNNFIHGRINYMAVTSPKLIIAYRHYCLKGKNVKSMRAFVGSGR